jgi:hypothetical protein
MTAVYVLAVSDLTAHKWAFDVSESLVSAIAGGLVLAIAAKRLGFAALANVAWRDLLKLQRIVSGRPSRHGSRVSSATRPHRPVTPTDSIR